MYLFPRTTSFHKCFDIFKGLVHSELTRKSESQKTSFEKCTKWTMSDMVKYKVAVWPFLKFTDVVFYHL